MRWGAEVRVLAATLKPAQIRENNKLWAVGTRFATQTFAGGGKGGARFTWLAQARSARPFLFFLPVKENSATQASTLIRISQLILGNTGIAQRNARR